VGRDQNGGASEKVKPPVGDIVKYLSHSDDQRTLEEKKEREQEREVGEKGTPGIGKYSPESGGVAGSG
jgi:hypothetical protein